MDGNGAEGQNHLLDADGYLLDFDRWTPQLAQQMAEKENIGTLGERHLLVIEYIRGYYRRHRVAPMLNLLKRECDLEIKMLNQLFGKNPGKRAAKLAGLPKQSGCV